MNTILAQLIALFSGLLIFVVLLRYDGWKIRPYLKNEYVGFRDFKLGAVLSGNIEKSLPCHSKVTFTLGFLVWLLWVKVEISRPNPKEPPLPFAKK